MILCGMCSLRLVCLLTIIELIVTASSHDKSSELPTDIPLSLHCIIPMRTSMLTSIRYAKHTVMQLRTAESSSTIKQVCGRGAIFSGQPLPETARQLRVPSRPIRFHQYAHCLARCQHLRSPFHPRRGPLCCLTRSPSPSQVCVPQVQQVSASGPCWTADCW